MKVIMDNVYLDYAATTPLDRDVFAKMEPYLFENFGNPSSSHFYGQKAEFTVENARNAIAKSLDAVGDKVIFTGSGSEGDNLATRGAAFSGRSSRKANKILISPVEHSAVTNTAYQLQDEFGFEVRELRVDQYGIVDLDHLSRQLDDSVALVSVIYGNNEIGSINPVHEIADLCHQKGILFHTDAVQACAHLDIHFRTDEIDLLTFAAHKFYGPKGVGALICREDVNIQPQITGGKQEHKMRAGTHNVPGIVGMAAALEVKNQALPDRNHRLIALRDQIISNVLNNIAGAHLTGHPQKRLPNHTSFVFEGLSGSDLVIALDMAGFSCSSGSACKVGDPKPSQVLRGLGLPADLALGSLRVTLGRQTTNEDVERFLETLPKIITRLRK
jgi:cysteine desulfurase